MFGFQLGSVHVFLNVVYAKKTKLSSIQFTKFLPLAFKDYIGWLMLESIECRWKFIDEFSKCCYDTQHSWICCKCCRAEYWNEKWTWRSINILSINKLTYVINFVDLTNSSNTDGSFLLRLACLKCLCLSFPMHTTHWCPSKYIHFLGTCHLF